PSLLGAIRDARRPDRCSLHYPCPPSTTPLALGRDALPRRDPGPDLRTPVPRFVFVTVCIGHSRALVCPDEGVAEVYQTETMFVNLDRADAAARHSEQDNGRPQHRDGEDRHGKGVKNGQAQRDEEGPSTGSEKGSPGERPRELADTVAPVVEMSLTQRDPDDQRVTPGEGGQGIGPNERPANVFLNPMRRRAAALPPEAG